MSFLPLPTDRVERLETQLAIAQQAVVTRLPESVREILDQHHATHIAALLDLRKALANEALRLAEPIKLGFGPAEALCPLCGDRSSRPYAHGFTVPEGLRKHLLGDGNAHPCPVLHTVFLQERDMLPHRDQCGAPPDPRRP